ncbi:MAG: hypothetical protein IKZ58_09560 [Selenomonadaceae bacterium]|nr:hypothetical protein [Selenomonadaceae bacterium]
MVFDDNRTLRTINDAPNSHVIKIFFYLAFHQPNEGIHGFRVSKKQLQFDLKLGRTVFFDALHWLKDNIVIHEFKLAEDSDFMVNPYIVMNNGDRDARIAEWNRRCKLESDKIRKSRERKRLKQNNQQ